MGDPVLPACGGGSAGPGTVEPLKPFKCNLCGYRCAVKSHLTAHQRTHSGEKPFGCDLCGYRCTVKSKLVLHQRTHSGEKPFGCDLCSYRCARKTHLTAHRRTHEVSASASLKRTAARCEDLLDASDGSLASLPGTDAGESVGAVSVVTVEWGAGCA